MKNYTKKVFTKILALLLTGMVALNTSATTLYEKSSGLTLGNSDSNSSDFDTPDYSSPLGLSLVPSSTKEEISVQEMDAILGMSAFAITPFSVVSTFQDLEAALAAKSPSITLAANIVMQKQLRIIGDVVIDGNGHTITENNRYNFMVNQDNVNIEIKNMSISGFNFYGFITTSGSSLGKNAVVTYNKVNYSGPQLAFLALNNTLRLIDSQIILASKAGSDATQELAEVAFIEIGGNTLVHKTSGGDAFMWFKGSTTNAGGLTILDNANVTLQNDTTYLNYNDVSLGVDMVVGENAALTIIMQTGMNYATGHTFRSATIKNGATVQLESVNTGRPLAVKDNLNIEDGATFILTNQASSVTNVLFLTTTNTVVTINNPKLVYIKGRSAGYIPNNISLTGNVFNTFYNTTLDNGGYPSNAAVGNNGIANGHSTAYPEDFVIVKSKADPMNYFNNSANNGFIMGQFDMSSVVPNPPTAYDTNMTLSMPYQSEAKMTFTPRGETVPKSASGVANSSGIVTLNSGIPLDENGYGPFVAGDEILLILRKKIENTTSFLHVNGAVKVINLGELALDNVPTLQFGTNVMVGTTMIYPLTQDAVLSVKDDRSAPSEWQVSVRASQFTEVGGSKTLDPNTLGFMDSSGFTSLENSMVIWESTTNSMQPIQSKSWQKGNVVEGFAVEVLPFQTAAPYSATLTWSLEITP